MPQHATQQNVRNLAGIVAEASRALATSTESISNNTFMITDQPLLEDVFSGLASRLDNISSLVDQFDKLDESLRLALSPPAPTS